MVGAGAHGMRPCTGPTPAKEMYLLAKGEWDC